MKDFFKLVFNWIKMNFAKEALLTAVTLVLTVLISYILHSVIWDENNETVLNKGLNEYNLDYIEYRIFIFLIILVMIYGIRFVDRMLNVVLLKEEPKE